MPAAPTTNQFSTIVRNTSGSTMTFSFLPPHGRTLTAGQEYSFAGDIQTRLGTGGRINKRKFDAFKAAILAGNITVRQGSVTGEVALCEVLNTTVIAAGDLVFIDNGSGGTDVKSAAVYTWTTNILTTQTNFKAQFLGVALAAHANGGGHIYTFPVDVSPDLIWQFPCTSETHNISDTLGLAKAAGNALLPQSLVKATAAASIARCTSIDSSVAVIVNVRLESEFRGFDVGAAGSTGATGPQGFQGASG